MPIAATSVVSAAVIGGDLILGLSDGAIINCGRVQGPQGLKGDQGPIGATGRAGTDGNTIHTVQGAPDGSLGRDGDFAINTVVWEIYGPRSGGTWGTGTPLRGNKRGDRESKDPIFGMQSNTGGDGGGGGTGQTYTTANLPLAGTGRLIEKNGRVSAPGGNIIPEGNGLKYQSNLNSWIYNSLAALDEALPITSADTLPDKGKYEGDMVLFEGALWVWNGSSWIEVGGAVDVSDFALKSSVQRVEDNLDLVQETVGAGKYTRVAKPLTPVGPGEGEACFLQDGGAEATTFAEVENIQLNKVGVGPYADFSSAKKGDYLLIQSAVDGDFGLYVIRNAMEFSTFWDFGLEISSGKVVGTVPVIGEGIVVRTSRPTFTVAQDTPPDFSATGQLWFDTAEHQLKVWDDEEQEFVVTSGGAEVHVGEDPPADAAVGDLWYCTKLDDLTLYVLAEKVDSGDDIWAAAAPPVSLEGLEETASSLQKQVDYIAKNMTPFEVHQSLYGKHEVLAEQVEKTTEELDKKVSLYGSNTVEPDGGEWRIQGNSKTFIKVDTNGKKLGLFNLQEASEDHHAISRGWAKSNTVLLSGTNTVSNGWKIQSSDKSHFHVENNQTKIYWLQDPSHAQHPVTMGWADNKYALKSDIPAPDTTSYLPITGGKLTGNLSFGNNARIDCNNGSTVLSGRGCFELRANAEKPLIFSSGSGSKKLLSFYGYDGSQPDNKGEKAYITAGGEARFKGVYSNGKELATKEYVDASVPDTPDTRTSEDIEWEWHTKAANTIGKGKIYFKTNEIGSVTYIRIPTEGKDGKKFHMVNFSRKDWQLPFNIYAETEEGKHIIAAGRTSYVECKTASNVQYVELEFTNSSDMLNWRRDSVDDLTLVKVKVAGILP